jgi:hypothetical protein
MDADSVARNIDAAVIAELERLAVENGIPPLHWQILAVSDTILFDGIPEPVRASDTCIEWASALGMRRYEFESCDGFESWYLNVGPWSLEISSRSSGPE